MELLDWIARTLSLTEHQALCDAVEQVDDFVLGELVERYDAMAPETVTAMFSSLYLPHRYDELYDFAMLRRLQVCLVVVVGRLQQGWEPPRCRGEELILRAVLDRAGTCFEEQTDTSTDVFDDLAHRLFDDLDVEYLFDPGFDGIDDPNTPEGSRLGVQKLHPSAWFEPFRYDDPVHPLLH